MAATIKMIRPAKFPALLREISDPPPMLYLRGDMPPDNMTWLTVVGSRSISPYGLSAARELVSGLRGLPVVIVSGLALGTDAAAHAAALAAGLKTVAVPGSGLDPAVLYPATNRRLAEDILDGGGALLSEFPPETRAAPHFFPRRNRIMAGLSQATLIIEATERSGTLITARLALEYNRDVLAVPGSIFSSRAAGSHALIKDGARLISSLDDLILALGFEPTAKRSHEPLSENEEKVLLLLETSPLTREELFTSLKLPTSDIASLLTLLEIKGVIKEELGRFRAS